MEHDRITAIRVEGLRCVDDATLALGAHTVLIGPNGAGKSSLIEACELLRKAGTETSFLDKVHSDHSGASALLRGGRGDLAIEAEVTGADATFRYRLRLVHEAPYLHVQHELLERIDGGRRVMLMQRDRGGYSLYDRSGARRDALDPPNRPIGGQELALRSQAPMSELARVARALAPIEVHPPMEIRPRWVDPRELGARGANVVQVARRLEPGARNLGNVLFALRNQRNWHRVLEDLRLGLGQEVEDVVVKPVPSGGQISVEVRFRRLGDLPMFALSDGQVAFLAQIAIAHHERPQPAALVVMDEPDLHFHPALAARVAHLTEDAATRFPVLVATQSDAFLDALSEPARSAVLCELDDRFATQLSRPDETALAAWLAKYRGLGEVRRQGYERIAFQKTVSRASDGS